MVMSHYLAFRENIHLFFLLQYFGEKKNYLPIEYFKMKFAIE